MRNYFIAACVLCLALAAPAQAAEEARTAPVKAERAAPQKSEKARPAGEALSKEMFDRASPSEQAMRDTLLPLTGTWTYMATVWAPGRKKRTAR